MSHLHEFISLAVQTNDSFRIIIHKTHHYFVGLIYFQLIILMLHFNTSKECISKLHTLVCLVFPLAFNNYTTSFVLSVFLVSHKVGIDCYHFSGKSVLTGNNNLFILFMYEGL